MSKNKNYIQDIELLINNSNTLSDYRKDLLKFRYLNILKDFKKRCVFYSFIFHLCRISVAIGSLLVPALLAIQYSRDSLIDSTKSIEIPIYWTTWAISLIVTIANGIYTLFKIDKKYYFLHSVYEKLQSEGWKYLELTGAYSGILNKIKKQATHSNQFLYFCHNIEKIKNMQVSDEYIKIDAPVQSGTPEKANDTTPVKIPMPEYDGNLYDSMYNKGVETVYNASPRNVYTSPQNMYRSPVGISRNLRYQSSNVSKPIGPSTKFSRVEIVPENPPDEKPPQNEAEQKSAAGESSDTGSIIDEDDRSDGTSIMSTRDY